MPSFNTSVFFISCLAYSSVTTTSLNSSTLLSLRPFWSCYCRGTSVSGRFSQVGKTRSQLHSKEIIATLRRVKSGVFALKQGVEDFNDIFGWAILFNIFSCVSRTLVYIDLIVKKSDMWLTQDHLLFYYDICFVVITWVELLRCAFRNVTPFWF
jgi:hypothetical protein